MEKEEVDIAEVAVDTEVGVAVDMVSFITC